MNKDINIIADVNVYMENVVQERLMVANHKDICNMCFEKVRKGDPICWYGKGLGVRHMVCYLKRASLLTKEELDKMVKEVSDW